jgi:hypothetical protein
MDAAAAEKQPLMAMTIQMWRVIPSQRGSNKPGFSSKFAVAGAVAVGETASRGRPFAYRLPTGVKWACRERNRRLLLLSWNRLTSTMGCTETGLILLLMRKLTSLVGGQSSDP